MLLHFILLMGPGEIESRRSEYAYASKMADFFKSWIGDSFGREIDVQCDEMLARGNGILSKPGIPGLLRDHRERGESIWHFYLANSRPLWTDSLSEGYHSENMCMVFWQRPKGAKNETLFLAEKNCTAVSYEIAHEIVRELKSKKALDTVNDVWSRHFSGDLKFASYGADHARTTGMPEFLTIDPDQLSTIL